MTNEWSIVNVDEKKHIKERDREISGNRECDGIIIFLCFFPEIFVAPIFGTLMLMIYKGKNSDTEYKIMG